MTAFGNSKWTQMDQMSLRNAIETLVRIPSITHSDAENEVARYLADRLRRTECHDADALTVEPFMTHNGHQVGTAALYRRPGSKRTVVMIAHTDVVGVDDFGPYRDEAFDVNQWTHRLLSEDHSLPDDAAFDLHRGDWWFGRGVMDMKAGLALNLVLFEKACREGAPGNLIFLAVPDEESLSHGMIAGVELLHRWRETFHLEYSLCLNSEPSFVPSEAATGSHIYSGSFGKMLLGALTVGIPGHAALPFSGVNAVQMVTHLAQTLESNPTLSERTDDGRLVPLTCLWLRDLQETYSTQSPHMAAAFFHVPYFNRRPSQVLSSFRLVSQEAMDSLREWTAERALQAGVVPTRDTGNIPVVWLSEVMRDNDNSVLRVDGEDMLNGTLAAVRDALQHADVPHHAQVVLFLAPPVYPAVDSTHDKLVKRCIHRAQKKARAAFGLDLEHRTGFPGLSDLSYTGYELDHDWGLIAREMPAWGSGYSLPIQTMQELGIPVCNLGPFGKDAHQWTERLDIDYATRILPVLSMDVIDEALLSGKKPIASIASAQSDSGEEKGVR